jgi:hypothetical protein
MDVNGFMDVLKRNNAMSCYGVNIPSMNSVAMCSSLSVSQKKSLAKMSLDVDDDNVLRDSSIRVALIKELMVDKTVDVDKFTCIDFMAVLCQIALNNVVDPTKLKVKCSKCDYEIKFPIDYKFILGRCMEYRPKIVEKAYDIRTGSVKFTLSDPMMYDLLSFLTVKNTITRRGAVKSGSCKKDLMLYYTISLISKIEIDGEAVSNLTYQSKIDMLKYLPSDIMYEEGGLIPLCLDKFPSSAYDGMFPAVVCPDCKDVKEGVVSFENFFII